MKISIISGSTRQNSASANVSRYLATELTNINSGIENDVFDLSELNLPMWDENTDLDSVADENNRLETSDAFVFVIPEWHGMVPPAVKNLFFLFGSVFRHKPAYLVTVSAGTGGRYPIPEMRASAYKNAFLNYIPVNTVIDKVGSVISEDGEFIAEKDYIKSRLDEGLRILIEYGKAFQLIRQSDIVMEHRFPNGV